jgi:hypothetical protein
MACFLIKEIVENLPNSSFAEKLQAVFFSSPKTVLQYLLWYFIAKFCLPMKESHKLLQFFWNG